jgi:hypothetical protein
MLWLGFLKRDVLEIIEILNLSKMEKDNQIAPSPTSNENLVCRICYVNPANAMLY